LVSETSAILQCIDRQNETKLLGETQVLRAKGTQRLNFAYALKDAGMAWLSALMKQAPGEAELKAKYIELLGQLPSLFGASAFLASPDEAGTRPGLADLLAFSYVATGERMGLDLGAWPRVGLWIRAMQMRPSVRSTQPAAP
jgi:glutathione S-transferase